MNVLIEGYSVGSQKLESRKTRANVEMFVVAQKDGSLLIKIKTNHHCDQYFVKSLDLSTGFIELGKFSVYLPEYRTRLFISNGKPGHLKSLVASLDLSKENIASNSQSAPGTQSTPQKCNHKSVILSSKLISAPAERRNEKQDGEETGSVSKKLFASGAPSGLTPSKKKANSLKSPEKGHQLKTQTQMPETYREVLELLPIHQQILDACMNEYNVFYTGGAGTGKTVLLSKIIESLSAKHGQSRVFVTATTGLAACAIGGTTVHQFAGIPALEDGSVEEVADLSLQISKNLTSARRWRQAAVLVIDEISMMSPRLLEALDFIARRVRCNSNPMGGLQVVFCGDFLQLPPVQRSTLFQRYSGNSNIPATANQFTEQSQQSAPRFCFQSHVWGETVQRTFVLTKVFRQKENSFAVLLEKIRLGKVDQECVDAFETCVNRKLDAGDGILPTCLFTHKVDVDSLNAKELSRLSGMAVTYRAHDSGDPTYLKMLQTHCPARHQLQLKIGAQVVLVKTINVQEGLVSGLKGVVMSWVGEARSPMVRFAGGLERVVRKEIFSISVGGMICARREQLPLDLAWGISIHKAQGMTVDKAVVNLRKIFEYGQAYVALSRVTSIEGLSLQSSITSQHVRAHPEVLKFLQLNTS